MSKDVGSFSLAFYIHSDVSNAELVTKLIAAIHDPQHVYLLHMEQRIPSDKKEEIVQALEAEPVYNNVHIATSDIVNDAGVSSVVGLLAGFTDLLALDARWTHVINLTPHFYPLIPIRHMTEILATNLEPELNLIGVASSKTTTNFESFIDHVHFDLALGKHSGDIPLGVPVLPYPHPFKDRRGFAVARADANMILSRKFVHYLLTNHIPRSLLLGFSNAIWVKELYFVTVAINVAEFRKTLVCLPLFRTVLQSKEERMVPANLDKMPLLSWINETTFGDLFIGRFTSPTAEGITYVAENSREHLLVSLASRKISTFIKSADKMRDQLGISNVTIDLN